MTDSGLPDPAAWIAGKLLPAPPPQLTENERERLWEELKKLLLRENDELKTRLRNYLRDYLGASTPTSTIVLLTARERRNICVAPCGSWSATSSWAMDRRS